MNAAVSDPGRDVPASVPPGAPHRAVIRDDRSAPEGWDEVAVRVPGGHVMQSSAWAAYRASSGWQPHFLTYQDGAVALALLRRSPLLPGVEAVVRRGPAHRDEPAEVGAGRAEGLVEWATSLGARDLFLDPERPQDPVYDSAMEAAGFAATDGLEPSIHVMRLELPAGSDEATLEAGLSKATRQRIRAAERAGTRVAEDPAGERLPELLMLMRDRAGALGIPLQSSDDFLTGWRILLQAGLARLLVADHDGGLVGGLFLHRHGGIHATAYSADDASRREMLPGTMHLVRWTAIRDALREGAVAIELGGVDLPGHREPPKPGEPGRGLYEHKRGFGAVWVERAAPRRIVLRPGADRLARMRRALIDTVRRTRR
jgi:lipid II:glycine glycyltransferase (peptidoglycan interpeptide bridge formation enzyme)